jgi:hypothetical protein
MCGCTAKKPNRVMITSAAAAAAALPIFCFTAQLVAATPCNRLDKRPGAALPAYAQLAHQLAPPTVIKFTQLRINHWLSLASMKHHTHVTWLAKDNAGWITASTQVRVLTCWVWHSFHFTWFG